MSFVPKRSGWKWFWRAAGFALAVVLALAVYGVIKARSMGFLRVPVYEAEPPELPALKRPAVLIFNKTNSFIHKEAIPAANKLFEELGEDQGWSVYLTDNGAAHNPADLAKFDVLVWNNVTGDVLTTGQRAAMRAWLEQGGGFVGLHSAGDGSHEAWPWYQDTVIRARFIGHPIEPQLQQAIVRGEPTVDSIVAGLPEQWRRTDEWYSFENSPRSAATRVLATVDESTYAPGEFFGKRLAMGSDHPIMWKHCINQGRAFYSAMGHTAESYSEPGYREILLRAINWAGGLAGGGPLSPGPGTLECEVQGMLPE